MRLMKKKQKRSTMSDTPFDPKSLKLDSQNIGAARPFLKTLTLEQRKALLPEARRQEAQLLKAQYSKRAHYSRWTEADWTRWGNGYSPAALMDPLVVPTERNLARSTLETSEGGQEDPLWPTQFQHLRQYTRTVQRCVESEIAVPDEADWIFLDEFSEGLDESLRSPARVWVAKKGDEFFLRIDDGAVAEEKTRNGWNLVGLMHNIALTGSVALKRAITGRSEFEEIASSVEMRIRHQRKSDPG
jgi:hypothetical protein